MANFSRKLQLDWWTIVLYGLLVSVGWINIYSASYTESTQAFFDFSQIYFKQLFFIALSIVLIIFILALDSKFYERFSSVIYLVSLASLLGLFVFGKNINGATSWYAFGSFGLQPSEFAKAATALALGKYVSDIQTNMNEWKHQIRSFLIIVLPALLIIAQPDPGSALVYAAFLFPMYREGLHYIFLLLGFMAAALFVGTLSIGTKWMALMIAAMALAHFLFRLKRNKRPKWLRYAFVTILCIGFSFSVNYVFNTVFEQRHRDRFNIVLGKEVDEKGIGYNTNQSEIAIGSGGWTGKGWLQGTQTKGNFVPEQHTDYIFSTIGEEWGFLGSLAVVVLFVSLIIRLLVLSERQKSIFGRVYGYSVASILFFHFFVNVGMVTGLLPTIGIPLPFISYGGSGLWGFTILLFIFVKLDATNYIHS
ncbi:MAG TPA: rod shape-determining protein RodA [Flavobacteriaceae bacterium]|nr:rod shape-determining protein RodA [Flavobacteriaceae bacterium]HPF11057.1 rod shape-determining protein RodA [Flavobacteriaceae bacterium]HQU22126.1 rod shape-determining protein RodA [Flavobacteriaceae bacterium]HQU64284.1 rod shape-determining protein RodA [Flavobacteriaceae bacterium]HRW44295.1 rod shape-determining protein RodA [Flavobacteriaceae bacterium]